MSNVTLCPFEITDTHICYPTKKSTWYLGTNDLIKWFVYDPIYHNNYSSLSLYFYYRKNYQYYQTVNFTNIGIDRSFYPLFIDNSFFPINCTENELRWDYSLLLLGDKENPNIVLNSTFSKWIPTNFILIQNASQSCSNNTSNVINSPSNEENNIVNNKIDTWKIIVIIVLIFVFLLLLILILFFRKKFFKKNKKEDDIYEIIVEKNIIIKNMKPDENIIKKEKPNSY
jgi:hypothetical protein